MVGFFSSLPEPLDFPGHRFWFVFDRTLVGFGFLFVFSLKIVGLKNFQSIFFRKQLVVIFYFVATRYIF